MKTLDYFKNLDKSELIKIIEDEKKKKNAVILAHNYQRLEVQEIGDKLGDSLGLSRAAAAADADIILFCGVQFMAETAKILSPDKKVLMPEISAGCEMADMIDAGDLAELKEKHPDAEVVCYVNSTAEVKALSDVCVTSSNAVEIVKKLKSDKIIFVPDQNLAKYVQSKTDKEIIIHSGYCYVHHQINAENVKEAKSKYPDALFIPHPECPPEVLSMADYVGSTSQMQAFAEKYDKIILGTEIGLVEQLQKKYPNKTIVSVKQDAVCFNMKKTTLAKTAWSIVNEEYEVTVPADVAAQAKKALDRMLELS